jgi:Putative adhesin
MSRLSLLTLAATVLVTPSCAINIDQEGYIAREEKRFPAATVVDLHLYTFDGGVEVRSWDKPEIVVEVEKRGQDQEAISKIQILAERTGNRIQIEARHPGNRSFAIGRFTSPSARFLVTVPRKTNLVIRSGDGSIVVERVSGRHELRTSDGGIRTLETTGELLAESGDGTIQLEEAGGRIEARTLDGSLRVTGTPTSLRARSGDGSVVLRIRRGAVMSEDWVVTTEDGPVSVELPDGFSADIEADPGSDGRARSDLTLVNVSGGTRTERILRGRLGQGGHRLLIRTGDGTIKLTNY